MDTPNGYTDAPQKEGVMSAEASSKKSSPTSTELRRRAKFLQSLNQRRSDETAALLTEAADQIDRLNRALVAAQQFQVGDEVSRAINDELSK